MEAARFQRRGRGETRRAAEPKTATEWREAFGMRPGLPALSDYPPGTKAEASSTHSKRFARLLPRSESSRVSDLLGWSNLIPGVPRGRTRCEPRTARAPVVVSRWAPLAASGQEILELILNAGFRSGVSFAGSFFGQLYRWRHRLAGSGSPRKER